MVMVNDRRCRYSCWCVVYLFTLIIMSPAFSQIYSLYFTLTVHHDIITPIFCPLLSAAWLHSLLHSDILPLPSTTSKWWAHLPQLPTLMISRFLICWETSTATARPKSRPQLPPRMTADYRRKVTIPLISSRETMKEDLPPPPISTIRGCYCEVVVLSSYSARSL